MTTPIKGVAFDTTVELFDVNFPGRILLSPTIADGDFQISKDQGAFVNLTNLPVVTPGGGGVVVVSLTADEMDADVIQIKFIDPDFEWSDGVKRIDTVSSSPLPPGPDLGEFTGVYDVVILARENGIPFLTFYPHSMRRTLERSSAAEKLVQMISTFNA